MKPFFFFVFFIFSISTSAQDAEWFELGTTWVYNWNSVGDISQEDITTTYSVTELTDFLGQPCSKIEPLPSGLGCLHNEPPYYMYESNDTVYYATQEMDSFAIGMIYSDGAEWIYTVDLNGTQESMSATVSGLTTVTIDGQELAVLQVTYSHLSGFEGMIEMFPATRTVWEYMGDPAMFIIPFGKFGICDIETNLELRCFTSPSLDYLNPDFSSCTLSLDEVQKNRQIFFPNPATESISWAEPIDQISLFDVTGKLILQKQINSEQYLSVEHLPPGIYTVLIKDGDTNFSQKIIIE
ncbi:T9SS type A sorting domain-containing protein [Cryomorphaceae bacterium 1068]|nr:T9SS type A sorting domain-containing protein [Cryomorphaceae bacterium 1068]